VAAATTTEAVRKHMADRDDEPTDLFDAVCRLDDLAEWLTGDYPDEAAKVREVSLDLKGHILIVWKGDQETEVKEPQ
jgi:hypothetical protein